MRCAIYARFSTDLQSATSTDDQARICRSRADALGLSVVGVYADQAVSGATPVGQRDAGARLLADALAGRFDVLIVEGLDRLSRDQVDQESVVRRLEHRNIRIVALNGYDSEMGASRKLIRAVRGMIDESYIDDLRGKTHRGLAGQIGRGFHAGGLSFGYRSVVSGVNAKGEAIGHRLEVDLAQAAIVREIFARYGAGDSCQRIAADLNGRAVAGPRGGTWCVSALYGSPAKGSGILNNDLYAGRYIWNRSRWAKDPDTKRRERIARPQSEWQIVERPDLRIVDAGAWDAVRARMATPLRAGGRRGPGRDPTTLFGGLLRCGHCGGAMVAVSATNYGCAAAKDRGAAVCRGVQVRRREVDEALIAHLREAILAPDALASLDREAKRLLAAVNGEAARTAGETRRQEAEIRAEVGRLTEAIAAVGISAALADRLRQAETRLDGVKRARTRANIETLPSAIAGRVRAVAQGIDAALREDVAAARPLLREAFGEVRLVPKLGTVYAEFEDVAARVVLAVSGASINRVAGGCYPICLRIGPDRSSPRPRQAPSVPRRKV